MRLARCIVLAVVSVLAACDGSKDTPAPTARTQSADEAASLLCEGAQKAAADPATADVLHWFEDAGPKIEHTRVREVMEQLARDGGRNSAEVFFEAMQDVLGHPYDCPAAARILGRG